MKIPSKIVPLDLLSFLCYLELCIKIFMRDRSAPETHESGEFFAWVRHHGGTPFAASKGNIYRPESESNMRNPVNIISLRIP